MISSKANVMSKNKVTKESGQNGNGDSNSGSSSSGGSATQKGSSSGTSRVKTGVETSEFMYAGIGLIGMIVAIMAMRKGTKKSNKKAIRR